MAPDRDIDVQAQSILDGLRALANLLDEPVARDALDLAERTGRAQTHAQYDLLRRLRRSLSQYLERDGDLFYVGLLGHFSAGKSSTINSILGLWNTDNERQTDLNPTDTTITLITREENVKSLLGVIKEGHVTIRYQGVDNPLLENVVLADTPGTGDPHLIQEISRDFLPMCDVILFFFSATSPLDQTDIPLLAELHHRLPFIPIKFIVTRADEFRLDANAPISDRNFDKLKRSRFFSDVLSRINKLLQPAIYTEQDFILIDNKKQYNIEELTTLIRNKCDPTSSHSKIVMHGHKIQYFMNTARALKSFFADFLSNKLQELNKILQTAEQNIQRYNENVRISNNHLTLRWHEQLGSVRTAREAALKTLFLPDQPPTEIARFPSVLKKSAEIDAELSTDLYHVRNQLTATFKSDIFSKLRHRTFELELPDLDSSPSSDSPDGALIRLGPVAVDPNSLAPLTPLSLTSQWAILRESKVTALRDDASSLRKSIEQTQSSIEQRTPLFECEQQVRSAQKSLSDDLDQFFRNVELYRDGVFSHTTKESISTLGVGAKLDALEREFTPSDKAKFTGETMEKLFPRFGSLSAGILTQFSELDKRVRPLTTASKDLKIPSPETSQTSLSSTIEAEKASLNRTLMTELQESTDLLKNKIQLRLSSVLVDLRRRYSIDIKSARQARIARYLLLIFGAVGIAAVGWFGYLYLKQPIPHDIFNAVAWEVVGGLIVAAIGYWTARIFDNFPAASKRLLSNFHAKAKWDINRIAEEELKAHEFTALEDSSLINRLKATCNGIIQMDPDDWNHQASERLNTLRELYINCREVQAEYAEMIERTTDEISAYFSDATKNLEALTLVADQIKEQAIQPSFDLLAQTSESLNKVQGKIREIEFN